MQAWGSPHPSGNAQPEALPAGMPPACKGGAKGAKRHTGAEMPTHSMQLEDSIERLDARLAGLREQVSGGSDVHAGAGASRTPCTCRTPSQDWQACVRNVRVGMRGLSVSRWAGGLSRCAHARRYSWTLYHKVGNHVAGGRSQKAGQ
eukprot:scaffold194655_cov18-Tisochrysis_lutea.AAC.1